jgi:hypothetical protein
MDARSERYALDVASAIADSLGSLLAGVYLHGSAVLGGFDARRSDVDILAVSDGPMTRAQQSAAAGALSEQRLPCPAKGLELSIVMLGTAGHPTAAPPFELHVSTAADDTSVHDGHQRSGDPDLVLHFAVCRSAGRLLGPGRPAAEVFAPVADDLVLAQLADELRWGVEYGAGEAGATALPASGSVRRSRHRGGSATAPSAWHRPRADPGRPRSRTGRRPGAA